MNDLKEYKNFIKDIEQKIRQTQYEAMKVVNTALINLYWEIGKSIYEKQEKDGWGQSIVEELAKDLKVAFPDVKGFSGRNLRNMKLFYVTYKDNIKLQPLVAKISWTKNIVIMEKCKDDLQREFYIKMTKKYGWTKSLLIHHIENQSYEKYLLNQTNFDKALPEKVKEQGKLAVKDEYIFDFLELDDEYTEKELQKSLLNNIRAFLQEMGGDFAYIGNEYNIKVGGDDFYIDLLLYHRILKCLVAIELKTREFKPEDVGKLQFYLTALDRQVKTEDENPSIGIIICKSKNKTVVEYALNEAKNPMGVATYKMSKTLPKELENLLPSPKEIEERLNKMEL